MRWVYLVSRVAQATRRETRLYLPHPMNLLVVGADKEPLLRDLPARFLLIDDGPLIDRLTLPERRRVVRFDTTKHTFNPLQRIDYHRARAFLDVVNSVFPEGESTLTRRVSNFHLLQALLGNAKRLDQLITPSKENADAWQKIETLLLSPVLRDVLTKPTNFSFTGTIVARLDRAALGDFDCFVLANLLIALYPYAVIIPDFGFYRCKSHGMLFRQSRLRVGIESFASVPEWEHRLLTVPTKIAARCTPDDADTLAVYSGIPRNTVGYHDFINSSIS